MKKYKILLISLIICFICTLSIGLTACTGTTGETGAQGEQGIQGEKGDTGEDGEDGEDGNDGLSAYQLYCDANPAYTGDLDQWLDDLVNGRIATAEYTVTFDSNGGSDVAEQTVKKGEKATEPATPDSDAAYTLDGWYLGNEKWSFIGYTVTEDITLTAKWVLRNKELAFTEVYDAEDNTKIVSYSVSGYSGSDAEIIIPEYYNDYPVTSISENAFKNNSAIISVVIPDSVTSIGTSAFNGCAKLAAVTLPATLKTLGSTVFSNTVIDKVYYNGSLADWLGISYGSGSSNPMFNGAGLYFTDNNGSYALVESVTITGVSTVNSSAFYGCTSLTSVTICDGVTSVGSYAFRDCGNLKSVTIGDSVTSMGTTVFSGCSSLESIALPFAGADASTTEASETTVFGYIFGTSDYTDAISAKQNYASGCNTTYYIPATLTTVTITSGDLLYGAFNNCTALTNVTIGDSVTSIGESAFNGCTSLTTVTLPATLKTLGSTVFSNTVIDKVYYNGSLADWLGIFYGSGSSNPMFNGAELYFTDNSGSYELVENITVTGVTAINSSAFYGCISLKNLTIESDVTSVDNYAFRNCCNLTTVMIGDSVTTMGTTVFSGCSSLESITLPFTGADASATAASETTVFGYIFGTSSYTDSYAAKQKIADGSTKTYYIPSTLTTITITGCNLLYGALSRCTSVTSVIIGSGITSFGVSAFNGCTDLKTITLPSTLKYIYGTVFSDTSINEVYFNGGLSDWLGIDFNSGSSNPMCYGAQLYFTDNNGDYELVENLTITNISIISGKAFYGCTSLTSLAIGSGVTHINDSAFRNCTSLTSVTLGGELYDITYRAFEGCTSLTDITMAASMKTIGSHAFYDCTALANVYYYGTAENWGAIDISASGSGNANLTSATIYYYSETEPTGSGKYWHYVDGVVTIWKDGTASE